MKPSVAMTLEKSFLQFLAILVVSSYWLPGVKAGYELNVSVPHEGAAAELTCVRISEKDARWYKAESGGEIVLENSTKYFIHSNSTHNILTVNNVSTHDCAIYDCKNGIFEGVIYLRMAANFRHYGHRFPKSKNIREGESYCMECRPIGCPDDFTYTWTKDGEPVTTNEHVYFLFNQTHGLINSTLCINEGRKDIDNGNYSCHASNGVDEGGSTHILIRIKDRYAALWPFIGIIAQAIVLALILYIAEKRKKADEEPLAASSLETLQERSASERKPPKRKKHHDPVYRLPTAPN